jgi:hypothetical protein
LAAGRADRKVAIIEGLQGRACFLNGPGVEGDPFVRTLPAGAAARIHASLREHTLGNPDPHAGALVIDQLEAARLARPLRRCCQRSARLGIDETRRLEPGSALECENRIEGGPAETRTFNGPEISDQGEGFLDPASLLFRERLEGCFCGLERLLHGACRYGRLTLRNGTRWEEDHEKCGDADAGTHEHV